jgi:hypothetical protein
MMTAPIEPGRDWTRILRRYLAASAVLHLVWEVVQLPLYTIWSTGTLKQQAFAVLHCTVGDVVIAALALVSAWALAGRPTWPVAGALRVYGMCLAGGAGYTIYSEWVNVSVRASWAYSKLMLTVPLIGTGFAPLLQWLFIPTLALWIAIGRAPWIDGRMDRTH